MKYAIQAIKQIGIMKKTQTHTQIDAALE